MEQWRHLPLGNCIAKVLLPGSLILAMVLSAAIAHAAASEKKTVGKVVALRGKATIERGASVLDAAVNTGIELSDTIRTSANARVKLHFEDDSVLTVGENSQLQVKEFLYSKGKGGKSIFNLIDGKMHSVVGKTKFEVQTPTAVASARGTVIYFEVAEVEEDAPQATPPPSSPAKTP